ncbi:YjfB family protein [Kaarinaea lacus]
MEITGISTAAVQSAATASSNQDVVATKMLKKTLDIQEQTASQLIESIPDPDSNLGQNINIKV